MHSVYIQLYMVVRYTSFDRLFQNTIGINASLYTGNKQTPMHSLYIQLYIDKSTTFIIHIITCHQIIYIQKENAIGIINQNIKHISFQKITK